jgi:hypothetical protein
MANRLNAPNQFETLSPPWILSQLDTNFTQNQAAWNDSSLGFVNGIPVDTGTPNAYVVALPLGSPSAYQDGMTVPFIPANTNTGASTMTVSPLGSAAILNPAGLALTGGEISKNAAILLIYKSAAPTGFRIVGPCGLNQSQTGLSGTATFNCAGYSNIFVFAQWTSGTNLPVALNNVSYGVPIQLVYNNATGASAAASLSMTDPAGTAYTTITAAIGGAATGSGNTNIITGAGSVTLANTFNLILMGGTTQTLVARFKY